MLELKPCPFCNSECLYILKQEDSLGLETYYVFCNSCKTSFNNEQAEDSKDDTIKWWNSIIR